MSAVKIAALKAENIKCLKSVYIECASDGLTIIGGGNGQGKTSCLDAIAYALGGERFRPTDIKREGSVIPGSITLSLSNGLVVERSGEKSRLKVTDPEGRRGGQALLNEFVEVFALDLPKFMASSDRAKAEVLLDVIGVKDQLAKLEREEKSAYDRRHAHGRIADQKKKYAEEMPYYSDAPDSVVSIQDLLAQQQAILAGNAEVERIRASRSELERRIESGRKLLADLETQLQALPAPGVIQDDSDIKARLAAIETDNEKARANLDKEKARDDAQRSSQEYDALTAELEAVRQKKMALLESADLPLPGLSVESGVLRHNGKAWDCMSGAEQMQVATAIVRRLNPDCGFVLLDKLEAMDLETLREFNTWLQAQGLQAIATRVSTGEECSLIIEDGTTGEAARVAPPADEPFPEPEAPKYVPGEF